MSEELIALLADSFWKILKPGLLATIPLTLIAFSFALVIATVVALIQFANIKVLKQPFNDLSQISSSLSPYQKRYFVQYMVISI